jgi:hypothetical protein
MNSVLTLLLSHQPSAELESLLRIWQQVAGEKNVLLAYGGDKNQFARIGFESKIFIDDPGLRTRDHQRERQSCSAVLREAARWMKSRPQFQYLHFVEYDHIPLIADLYTRMIGRLESEKADVLAFHLRRVDGTSDAHYLHHANEPRFHDFFSAITRRTDPEVVLAMLGTGSFWKREVFEAVTSRAEPFPIYFELYLPTLAHHLGYRLRDLAEQNAFVWHVGDFSQRLHHCRTSGAWTAHPVKKILSPSSVLIQ